MNGSDQDDKIETGVETPAPDHHTPHTGGVYSLTNAAGGNSVQAFRRDHSGNLTPLGSFPTGGYGTSAALGSQGAVRVSHEGRILVAVSAGSDQVTAFFVQHDGSLGLINTIGSGGHYPISVTLADHIAYVLNAGAFPQIDGFGIGHGGLMPLGGARRHLSPFAVGPAEVLFSPRGRRLSVSEKFSNTADIFSIGHHGIAGPPTLSPTAGQEPFGGAWVSEDRLLLTEAASGSVTLYKVRDDNRLVVKVGPVPNFQIAPCWVALTCDGRFAYVANTGSASVSSYQVGENQLTLHESVAAIVGGVPIDIALSRDSKYLYVLTGQQIAGFRVQPDGGLDPLLVVPVAPGSVGLAAV